MTQSPIKAGPHLSAASGGKPGIPSPDAGGVKMDSAPTATPGRSPDVKSAHASAKSGQATNHAPQPDEIPADVRKAAYSLAIDVRYHVATSRRELIKNDPELCRMLEDAIMADRKKMAERRRRLSVTAKQREALNFIKAYCRESRGVCPSYIEMRDALGLASTSGIYRLVNGLERRGHIVRERGRARTIQVIE